MQDVINYIDKNRERYLEELGQFLKIPSVSTDPAHKDDVARAARFVADQLTAAGMEQVEVIKTPGHPLVYGEKIADPSKPTVLVYGHYDVQPVDPIELWKSGPFEPTVRDGNLYARGSADDKGQVIIHFKSCEAYHKLGKQLPVNVKFLIEGEEEIGSSHLDPFIEKNAEKLKADCVLISDTAMFAKGVPSICYGLRGLAYCQVDVQGANTDLHSGSFGGPVPNPAFVLAQIIAALKDEDDRITIPGFYDDVRELTQAERDEFASLPFDKEEFKKSLGLKGLAGEKGFTPLEQVWARPTLEVNGLLSGFTGEGAKTVLPEKAMAKVSMRLAPDQDPHKIEDLFEKHVLSLAPDYVNVKVTRLHGGQPWVAPLDHPALKAAANAIEQGFGKRPVFQREGGSIPVVATFAEALNVPTVLLGIGLPDENAHAPNEHLNLDNFYGGLRAAAHFLEEFAKLA
ncbi:MAG TPA: dipeptidase [Acidobacteriota bacterium]|nr:dipeptidase [Acidobacteriota bacterium]